MSKKIRVGLVGCGYWGSKLARVLASCDGCELVMLCDADEGNLTLMRTLYPGVKQTRDINILLKKRDVEAVFIATPPEMHHPMAAAALKLGKHVFVEKPMAMTSGHCREMIELADKHELNLMVGHTFMYSPNVRKLDEIIQRGEIGPVCEIKCRRLHGIVQKKVNVAWDLAPHDISIALQLLKTSPISVRCIGSRSVSPRIEDEARMDLMFPGGVEVSIHTGWTHPEKVREVTVVGETGKIVYDEMKPEGEKVAVYRSHRFSAEPHFPFIEKEEPLAVECKHFLDCIASQKSAQKIRPITDGVNGHKVVSILEAASQSLQFSGIVIIGSPFPVPAYNKIRAGSDKVLSGNELVMA